MKSIVGEPWSIVLAGGAGERLRSLTTDRSGTAIPKQYCCFNGGGSLLRLALRRAERVTPWGRITTIVAEQHRCWWQDELVGYPASNVVAQPRNRGTAAGILLPALSILARDPEARILFLPSDHYIANEVLVEWAVRRALDETTRRPEGLFLLGMTPDDLDAQFGWIVPDAGTDKDLARVGRFVEKPPLPVAEELLELGGLWNSFIFVARATAVVALFEQHMPRLLSVMQEALEQDSHATSAPSALGAVYEELETADFCRDLLEKSEDRLWVLPVPPCGWSDLGTVERVARCALRLPVGAALPVVAARQQAILSGGRLARSRPGRAPAR